MLDASSWGNISRKPSHVSEYPGAWWTNSQVRRSGSAFTTRCNSTTSFYDAKICSRALSRAEYVYIFIILPLLGLTYHTIVALLFLHRGFFAQALTDNPTNPQLSTHGQSFITAFKCACAVLDSTIDQFNQQPDLTPRVWRIWSNAFSAAVRDGFSAIEEVD